MGKFKTLNLSVIKANPFNSVDRTKYTVNGTRPIIVSLVNGNWRSRPKGRRLFTPEQIRAIRSDRRSQTVVAESFDCSSTTIYHIKNRSIYKDVI